MIDPLYRTGKCATPDKQSYGSKAAALFAAIAIREGSGYRLRPYECECGLWHTSTAPPRGRRSPEALARRALRYQQKHVPQPDDGEGE